MAFRVAFSPSSDGAENLVSEDKLSGYIFMCSGKTKADCYRYRVFGLPAARLNVVKKIRPSMTLFLFDFESKLLYGIYSATSNGGIGIEPTAFQGKFLAQVRFEIFKDCLPLPESAFKHVLKDNYTGGPKFKQELNSEQVTNLMLLFRPIPSIPVPVSNVMPDAEISAAYDRYLAKQILNRSGQPSNHTWTQPAHHPFVPYASNVHMERATPAVCSRQEQPIYSRFNRSAAELQSSMPQPAAYWVAVACEDPYQAPSYAPVQLSSSSLAPLHFSNNAKQTYREPDQGLLPGSSSVAVDSQPMPYVVAAGSHTSVPKSSENDVPVIASHAYAYPSDAISAANASLPSYAQVPPHVSGPYGNAYTLSSSGAAAYWTADASQGHYQVNSAAYGNAYTSSSSAASLGTAAYWTTEANQTIYQVNSAANQMWSGYGNGYAYESAPVTNERLKAYDQGSYQVPGSSYEAVYNPPPNEASATWMATTGAPNSLN